jgi:uncharacterized protein
MNKRFLLIFLGLPVVIIALFLSLGARNYAIVNVNGKNFFAEVVDDAEKLQKGLGDREKICHSCAMLFDFEKKSRWNFWMKEMKFDLDIIWISDLRVAHIEKNVSSESKKVMSPEVEADSVLEINAGLSDKFGFGVGDEIKIYR